MVEPLELDYFEIKNARLPRVAQGIHVGLYDDGQKVPLSLYLSLNKFSRFQKDVLPKFLSVHHTVGTIEQAIGLLNERIDLLTKAGWEPIKETSTPTNPEHYLRYPITPSLYNQENGVLWLQANANKYIARFPFKNGVEDLAKARRNLQMYLLWLKGDDLWDR